MPVCLSPRNILQVEEHLLLYARIKGVNETRLRGVADEKMQQMDLTPFCSVKVSIICVGMCCALHMLTSVPQVST